MRNTLKSLLIKARIIPPDAVVAAAPVAAERRITDAPIQMAPGAPMMEVDPFYLGLRESIFEGWFNNNTDEVYPGMKVSADDTVLDLGCGDGGITSFCAHRGADIVIADIDGNKLETTRQRLQATNAKSVRTLVTDANPLPLPDACMTRVICTEVIEHVDDPVAVLAELVRIGKPGAVYLISVPDASGEYLQKPVAYPNYFEKPNHIRIIERDEFRAMIESSGLVIDRHNPSSFYWAIWWSFYWVCGQTTMHGPWHPLLQAWAQAWELLLHTPNGPRLKQELDKLIAKSQIIVAHKPAH